MTKTAHEPFWFPTPDGGRVRGFIVKVIFGNDPDTIHGVMIIADPRSSEISDIVEDGGHPRHEAWIEWDAEVFFYCDSVDEFDRICAEGSGDGWNIIPEPA